MAKTKSDKLKRHAPASHFEINPIKAHPILSSYFGYCLTKSALRFKTGLECEYGKHGVHPPQAGVLDILSKSGPLTQLALGDQLGADKATMVKLIDSLEALKLVVRKTHPEDRRAKTVEVTPKALKLLPKLFAARTRVEEEFLSGLTASEAKTFRELARKIFLSRYS